MPFCNTLYSSLQFLENSLCWGLLEGISILWNLSTAIIKKIWDNDLHLIGRYKKGQKLQEKLSGGLLPASESGILISVTGQMVRHLSLTKWHWKVLSHVQSTLYNLDSVTYDIKFKGINMYLHSVGIKIIDYYLETSTTPGTGNVVK